MTEIRKQRTTFWVLFVASLISIGWSQRSTGYAPQRIFLSIVASLENVVSAIGRGTVGTIRSVSELRSLRKEYDELLSELQTYRSVASDLDSLREENRRLLVQLGFMEQIRYDTIPARIVAKVDTTIYSSLTINRGVKHGVEVGQSVVAYAGGKEGLVGRVQTVADSFAIVLPVFAVNSYVGARLEQSRYEGLIEGTGLVDEPMIMRYVASEARDSISYGAPVVTSGLSSRFPAGLRIGAIREVSSPPYEPSLILNVDSVVDFDRLEYVAVLKRVEE